MVSPSLLSCLESVQLLCIKNRQNMPLWVGFLTSRFLSMASDLEADWSGSASCMHNHTLNVSFQFTFHHKMSWPLNCSMVLKKSATLWISQSFNHLLKTKFHPWGVQQFAMVFCWWDTREHISGYKTSSLLASCQTSSWKSVFSPFPTLIFVC